MIDFKNCGSVGYVCSSNYTSCSAGICSKVPGVRVTNPVPVIYTLNNSIDDQIFNVNLPFNITIYNVTKDRITVTSNGVSISLSTHTFLICKQKLNIFDIFLSGSLF